MVGLYRIGPGWLRCAQSKNKCILLWAHHFVQTNADQRGHPDWAWGLGLWHSNFLLFGLLECVTILLDWIYLCFFFLPQIWSHKDDLINIVVLFLVRLCLVTIVLRKIEPLFCFHIMVVWQWSLKTKYQFHYTPLGSARNKWSSVGIWILDVYVWHRESKGTVRQWMRMVLALMYKFWH